MRSTASWPGSRSRCCSPPSRSWPAHCWTARTPWGSAPPSWPATKCTAAVSCAVASGSARWAMCWRSARTTPLPPVRTRAVTAAGAAGLIPARAWHRMRTGSGTKGTRHYDWAMLEVTSDDTLGGDGAGHSVLLARRHRYTGQLSYYRCWTPGPVPLSRLIAVATARWRIEEDHQLSKQAAGLDSGQVIRWKSWHRWNAVCLLAYIHLAVAVALQREQDASSDLDDGLIPV